MLPKNYLWVPVFKLKIGGKLDTAYIIEKGTESLKRNNGTPVSDDIERQIAATWSQTIGRKATEWCLEDKFTEFGGDSMLMIAMCSSINETFDVAITTADFTGNDSLGAIANLVRAEIVRRKTMELLLDRESDVIDNVNGAPRVKESPLLVNLRESVNGEYSLYCVHPGDKHVRAYKDLAKLFPESYSVYGIRAPGSEPGEEVLSLTIIEYAQKYAKLVVKQHMLDKNDIHIFAYCGGGPIAVELTRTLQNSGMKVKSLTLCDPPNPFDRDENNDTSRWLATFFNDRYGLAIDEKDLREAAPSACSRKEVPETPSRQHPPPLGKRLSSGQKCSEPSTRLQQMTKCEKISEKPILKRTFTGQFDKCINEAVVKGVSIGRSCSYMKESLKSRALEMEERDDIMKSMKNAHHQRENEQRFARWLVGEFTTQLFPGTIKKENLQAFDTYEEMIEEFVKHGHSAGTFPVSIGVSFFLRFLQMARQLFNAVFDYVPTPLHLNDGHILYCSMRPNENRLSIFYPNFETWKDTIPQARTVKFNDWDHVSIFLEMSGLQQLVAVIRSQVEGIVRNME